MRKFNYTLAPDEVFDMAIKALKQYGELQEIRKEIDDLWYFPNPPYSPAVKAEKISVKTVLEILDKHISKYEDTL